MSRMSELDLCITEVAGENEKLRSDLIEEVNEHLNGLRPFHELSMLAQRAVEIWETANDDDIAYGEGHFGHPDDDDYSLSEECEYI